MYLFTQFFTKLHIFTELLNFECQLDENDDNTRKIVLYNKNKSYIFQTPDYLAINYFKSSVYPFVIKSSNVLPVLKSL